MFLLYFFVNTSVFIREVSFLSQIPLKLSRKVFRVQKIDIKMNYILNF